MSEIQPFRAVRYATGPRSLDIGSRLAPPYDVLDQRDKEELLARDPRNFVRIDLPHVPAKSAGPAEAYAAAQQTLQAWLADGTLVRDERPAVYVYHQKFRHEGVSYTRSMFFARLRLEPFGTGTVFPHEQTFGGPKEDRLCLTKATTANLSPIFGVYEDPGNEVSRQLARHLSPEPLARGTLDEVENYLWAVTDPAAIRAVADLMRSKAIYIADGHHRYGTSILYRGWLVAQQGELPADHPANYVLCVFCAMEDAGLLILPTHRVLPEVKLTPDIMRADAALELTPLKSADGNAAARALPAFGPQAVGMFVAASREYFAIRPRLPNLLDALEPQHSPAWRRLALAFLHAYLLERVVKPRLTGGLEPKIEYIKSAADAVAAAARSGGTAFLMQPTTIAELRGVCGAGDLMPQKSTYFYPKLASGLVINPLHD